MAMKCADLGHLASAESVHLKWVHALEEGMFRQGDIERERVYALSNPPPPGLQVGACAGGGNVPAG